MGVYSSGTPVTIEETFRNPSGVLTNPTLVVVTLQKPDGTQVTFDSGGVVENPSLGVYVLRLGGPDLAAMPGQYIYTVTGTGVLEASTWGEFTILQDPTAPVDSPFAQDGPCLPWCDSNDVWVACGSPVTTIGDGTSEEECPVDMSKYVQAASWLLWKLAGRQYLGICQRNVRPCGDQMCGFQVIEGSNYMIWPSYDGLPGWGWGGSAWNWPNFAGCSCNPLSRVRLAGRPVRSVLEVKLDGVVIPEENNWQLDDWRFLTRIADADGNPQTWPSCQRMDLPDTMVGTFSVTYSYGQDVPVLGQLAASTLACQFYNSISGAGPCALPEGTVRVVRQGITIDKMATLGWFYGRQGIKGWQTGIPVIDAFLNGANPHGLTRPPTMMTPGQRTGRFAQSVGS